MTDRDAFGAGAYQLTAALTLDAVLTGEAQRLGSAFAAIDPWHRLQFNAERLAAFISRRSAGVRLAIRFDGALAGFVCVDPTWLCGPYLHFLGVLPEHQGAGIGAAVVNWFTREAESAEDRNAWICVSGFNARARRFYAKHGFIEAAAFADLVRSGEDEILLRKQLFT
jgi:GNAT superfamily N-acetyltransferase